MKKINIYIAAIVALNFQTACQKTAKEVSTVQEAQMNVFVGTYTEDGSEGIYGIQLDSTNGNLSNKRLLVKTDQPTYLVQSKNKESLVAVNEDENGSISSFVWNKDRSKLVLVSQQSSMGEYPCHITLSNDGSLAITTNYMSGNMVAYGLDEQGMLDSVATIRQHEGIGANPDRQEGPHAHQVISSKDGKFLYAVDLGIDKIIKYPLDGNEIGMGTTALKVDPGDGPRHLVFHPYLDMVYVINELSNTIVSAGVDNATGEFTKMGKYSTLPDDFAGSSTCAAIKISKNGKHLYASNRGHNSIAVFEVDSIGGLGLLENESVQGDWPRDFSLSPDDRYLLVANRNSNNIVVLDRDLETGLLSYSGQQIAMSEPVCIHFDY